MTKKRSASRGRKGTPPKPASCSAPSQPPWEMAARVATVLVLSLLAVALVYPYSTLMPVVVVPVITGVMIGLAFEKPFMAASVGALAGLLGALSATITYTMERITATLGALEARGVSKYAFADIPLSVLDTLTSLWGSTPINAVPASRGALAIAIAGLTAGVAGGIARARLSRHRGAIERIAPWCAVALLAASMLWTGLGVTEGFRASVDQEPVERTYAYDPVFNLKTYYLMRSGQGFRESYLYAQAMDARKDSSFAVFEDGMMKFHGGSPAYQRQPAAFYLWRLVGARKASDIVIVSLVWCCLLLVGFFWALRDRLGPRAIAVAGILYPMLLLHTIWYNVFFPDWWAVLLFALSVIAMLRERYLVAGTLGLAAALFREILALWLLALVVAACLRWLRGDAAGRRLAAVYASGLTAFICAFAWHYSVGARYTARASVEQSGSWFRSVISAGVAQGTFEKLIKPTSYLMLPYGLYAVPGYLFLPAGAAGFWSVTKPATIARYALTGYPIAAFLLYATTGAMSSYWGMHVMPFAVLGTASLIASADTVAIAAWERRRKR